MFISPLQARINAKLKARIKRAEAKHADGIQQIEKERGQKLALVHQEHDAKAENLTNVLVESVIGPDAA